MTVGSLIEMQTQGSSYGTMPNGSRLFEKWWARVAEWPPTVFAITSRLLDVTGAYRFMVAPPSQHFEPCACHAQFQERVAELASAWVIWSGRAISLTEVPGEARPFSDKAATRAGGPPGRLMALGRRLHNLAYLSPDDVQKCDIHGISDSARAIELAAILLELHVTADQASAGFGIDYKPPEYARGGPDAEARRSALELALRLISEGTLAYLPSTAGLVLPKQRTPQSGMSVRSLSHHLAWCATEIRVRWGFYSGIGEVSPVGDMRLNLLLVPWPFRLTSSAIRECREPYWAHANTQHFGAFEYEPSERDVVCNVLEALNSARRECQEIHGVVLPECALTRQEFMDLIERLKTSVGVDGRAPFLLAGVRGERSNTARLALFPTGGEPIPFVQFKHHRWALDNHQIRQYSLQLPEDNRRYWEHIRIPRRTLRFTTVGSGLTMCHLICEDLARVDPTAHVIRAVGPNLVVALLLDGPQLKERWPARYATVLADDPGSSVLTLTSLGMCLRSRPRDKAPSRAVAMWREFQEEPRVLELDADARALVLRLHGRRGLEWTADGRHDGGMATELVFRELIQVRWQPPVEPVGGSPAPADAKEPSQKLASRRKRR